MKDARAKVRWGSQPGKERGGASRGERASIAKMNAARLAGEKAARDPRAVEAWCPSKLSEEERSYWRDGFRRERRR